MLKTTYLVCNNTGAGCFIHSANYPIIMWHIYCQWLLPSITSSDCLISFVSRDLQGWKPKQDMEMQLSFRPETSQGEENKCNGGFLTHSQCINYPPLVMHLLPAWTWGYERQEWSQKTKSRSYMSLGLKCNILILCQTPKKPQKLTQCTVMYILKWLIHNKSLWATLATLEMISSASLQVVCSCTWTCS
jgi:hypothetical protein